MQMLKYFSKVILPFFVIIILVASCGNHKKEEKKPSLTDLVNNPHTANGMDTVSAAQKPVIVFSDTLHDFGQIHEGEVVSYEFAFTNTGKTALIIDNAFVSCGCTVPDYPKEPIAPGESRKIKVSFNSTGKPGNQTKSVTLRSNTLRSSEMLYIKAEVKPSEK